MRGCGGISKTAIYVFIAALSYPKSDIKYIVGTLSSYIVYFIYLFIPYIIFCDY